MRLILDKELTLEMRVVFLSTLIMLVLKFAIHHKELLRILMPLKIVMKINLRMLKNSNFIIVKAR